MSITGHENEAINVQGLKASLQKFKTEHVDGGQHPDFVAGNVIGEFSDTGAEFAYRPTAGAVDIESGQADYGGRLERVKGNTIPMNQIVENGDFSNGYNGFSVSNYTASMDSDGSVKLVTSSTSYTYQFYQDTPTVSSHKYITVYCLKTDTNNSVLLKNSQGQYIKKATETTYKKFMFISSGESDKNHSELNIVVSPSSSSTYPVIINVKYIIRIDLTLIYGEGNEPTTPEAFEADYQKWFGKPLTYEEYDEGSLRNVKMSGIKTVGFNLYDGNPIKVLGSTEYQITGTYSSLSLDDTTVTPDAEGKFTPDTSGTLTVTGGNATTCVHFVHSGARDDEFEQHWKSTLNVPITILKGKLNGQGSSVVVFPDGMKKAGSVYDEIVRRGDKTYAIKRVGSMDIGTINNWTIIGSRAYGGNVLDAKMDCNVISTHYVGGLLVNQIADTTGHAAFYKFVNDNTLWLNTTDALGNTYSDEESLTAAMQGVILFYELETPQEYLLDDFDLPQVYDVDDYGTEEILLGINGCAPILDLKYGINAGDTIKNLSHNYVSAVGEQNFTESQKARARKNIGVIEQTQLDALTRHTRLTDFDLNVLKQAVADQNLEKYGLKVGDEKTINGHTYVIAGLNPMKGTTTPYRLAQNHVGLIVIPHTTQAWNASGNTSTGADGRGAGYMNSDLHYYLKNTLLPLVETDLGAANLLGHSKLLSNAVTDGKSSDWNWVADCKICALSEVQVYGATVWSSSGYDTGEACRQLDVFQRYNHAEIFGNEYTWLRDVVSATYAAGASDRGSAGYQSASSAHYVAALILFN